MDTPRKPPHDDDRTRVLLVCGSTRTGSSNWLALEAVHQLDHPDVVTDLYDRLPDLPAFVPGADTTPEPVQDLLDRIASADAVLFSTPEYAGALPGSLKNLLDWTVGGGQLYGKPTAWLDVANPGRGAAAREQLRTVLGYVGARLVDEACVHVSVVRDDAGTRLDASSPQLLAGVLDALVTVVSQRAVLP